MEKQILLTPGPTIIPSSSLLEESQPMIHHRTKEFSDLFCEIQDNLKYVFQTESKIYLLSSSGTGAMECAVVNFISSSDTVVVCVNGVFGERWVKILDALGANVITIKNEIGNSVSKESLEEVLRKNVNIKAVFTTLTDTSTTVVGDIKGYGELVAKTSAILIVDAISGLAGQPIYMDQWGCDVVVSASQKGFMSAPGLSMIAVNQNAFKLLNQTSSFRFYWDLRRIDLSFANKELPFTPPVSLIRATNASLKLIRKKTLKILFQDLEQLAQYVRKQGEKLGWNLVSQDKCNVLTGFYLSTDMNASHLIRWLMENYYISIAGGQESLKNKIIRIAHMGCVELSHLTLLFDAIRIYLKKDIDDVKDTSRRCN